MKCFLGYWRIIICGVLGLLGYVRYWLFWKGFR
jgi:hypothetical protein